MAVEGRAATLDGSSIPIEAHTLCIHGDGPTAADCARAVRAALEREGVLVRAMEDVFQASLR
jgi:UPF0271 protein